MNEKADREPGVPHSIHIKDSIWVRLEVQAVRKERKTNYLAVKAIEEYLARHEPKNDSLDRPAASAGTVGGLVGRKDGGR